LGSQISNSSLFGDDCGSFDDLFVDGLSLLDDHRDYGFLVQDWLDLFDDGLPDMFLDDRRFFVGLGSESSVLSGRSVVEISLSRLRLEACIALDDGSSNLTWQFGMNDLGRHDVPLSHRLNDFMDLLLNSLSVNHRLHFDSFFRKRVSLTSTGLSTTVLVEGSKTVLVA
jgi:hypothetical protein